MPEIIQRILMILLR